jgi:hypothetical protein
LAGDYFVQSIRGLDLNEDKIRYILAEWRITKGGIVGGLRVPLREGFEKVRSRLLGCAEHAPLVFKWQTTVNFAVH